MLGVAWPPRGLGWSRQGLASSAGRLGPSSWMPPSKCFNQTQDGESMRPWGTWRGLDGGGPCPVALPVSRCRSGCGWRGPGRRAAGTPRRWSRCSHRSRCRRPRCGQRGDPQLEGRETLTLTWVPCLGGREDVRTPAGQGTLPGDSWFQGTPHPWQGRAKADGTRTAP